MKMETQTVALGTGQLVQVLFDGGWILVDHTGCAKVGTRDGERYENLINPAYAMNSVQQPSKADRIRDYCTLLFESNRSGHKVDAEIDEALKAFKEEVGI